MYGAIVTIITLRHTLEEVSLSGSGRGSTSSFVQLSTYTLWAGRNRNGCQQRAGDPGQFPESALREDIANTEAECFALDRR